MSTSSTSVHKSIAAPVSAISHSAWQSSLRSFSHTLNQVSLPTATPTGPSLTGIPAGSSAGIVTGPSTGISTGISTSLSTGLSTGIPLSLPTASPISTLPCSSPPDPLWLADKSKRLDADLATKFFGPIFDKFFRLKCLCYPDLNHWHTLDPSTYPEIMADFCKSMRSHEEELWKPIKVKGHPRRDAMENEPVDADAFVVWPDKPLLLKDKNNTFARRLQLSTAWMRGGRLKREWIWRSLRLLFVVASTSWLLPRNVCILFLEMMEKYSKETNPDVKSLEKDSKRVLDLLTIDELQQFYSLWTYAKHVDSPIPILLPPATTEFGYIILEYFRHNTPAQMQQNFSPIVTEILEDSKMGTAMTAWGKETAKIETGEDFMKQLHSLHAQFFANPENVERLFKSSPTEWIQYYGKKFVARIVASQAGFGGPKESEDSRRRRHDVQIDSSLWKKQKESELRRTRTIFDDDDDDDDEEDDSKILRYEELSKKVLNLSIEQMRAKTEEIKLTRREEETKTATGVTGKATSLPLRIHRLFQGPQGASSAELTPSLSGVASPSSTPIRADQMQSLLQSMQAQTQTLSRSGFELGSILTSQAKV